MKKTLLSVIVILVMGTGAKAQIDIGLKAGVNLASYAGDEAEGSKFESVTGFHIGAVADFKIGETFSIQPEIVYSQQGAKRAHNTLGLHAEENLSYLNVPVALKYHLKKGLSVEAGPQVGILLSAESEVLLSGSNSLVRTDSKDAFETVDFGVFGGVGYALPFGVFFQARYAAGISSIVKKQDFEGVAEPDRLRVRNNVFSLSVGYKF